MDHFQLKLVQIFLLYIFLCSTQISCQCGETKQLSGSNLTESENNYLTVGNIFYKKSEIKTGDLMECKVTKTAKMESSKTDIHVFTQVSKDHFGYVFYPVSKDKKCFSFEVRTKFFPHIILSTTPMVIAGQRLEVILDAQGKTNSLIRTKDWKYVVSVPTPGIVNDKELRGFWIRWLDDHLLEVGREGENDPFMSYRLPEKLFINFIGILSFTVDGEWIIHGEPKCGDTDNNVTENMQGETKCKILPHSNLEKNFSIEKKHILEKLQTHILNELINQYEIFKLSKFRSKEILLEYQELIKMHFRNAIANQNQIYAADNELYCSLKAKTYNEITKKYFQFLEELQMELSLFIDATATSSEKLIENVLGAVKHCLQN